MKEIVEQWFKELRFGTIVCTDHNEVANWKVVSEEQKEALIKKLEEYRRLRG